MHGVEPLCRAGDREDLTLLHEEFLARRDSPGTDPSEPAQRQRLLLGMGHILGLDLLAWVHEQYLEHEPGQYGKVRAALVREGLLR